jgi:hypothetical protein
MLGIVSHLIPASIPLNATTPVAPKFDSFPSPPSGASGPSASPSRKRLLPDKAHATPSSRILSSDPRVIVIGPNSIRGRFTLENIARKRGRSGSDELTLRLRVDSLALTDLVTPFQSAMLEVRMEGEEPLRPKQEFSHPVSAGDHWDQDVDFNIPPDARQTRVTLRIHYYPESKEIPLVLPPQAETP